MKPLIALAILGAAMICAPQARAADAFDAGQLKRAYDANNQDDLPLVSWMDYGMAHFLLYPDGEVFVRDLASKSRLASARLSPAELTAAIETFSAQEGFWQLSPTYVVTRSSEQPQHVVSVRVPGKKPKVVIISGNLVPRGDGDTPPPPAFLQFIDAIKAVSPRTTQPWDPGYVEIKWTDYGYAPDESLPWPAEWPGLSSPLTRPVTLGVIKWITVFPSSRLAALDAFLARRKEKGAIVVEGGKVAGGYRWPMRNEKKWSSWTQ